MNGLTTILNPSSLRGHPDTIDVDAGGAYHFLGSWTHRRDGEFAGPWNWALSGRAHLGNFYDRRASTEKDERLNEAAKASDIVNHRLTSLRELGTSQRDLSKFVAQLDVRRRNLARIEPPSPVEAIYDIELARMYRELSGDARSALLAQLISGEASEHVTAMMRSPRALWPVESRLRETIVNNWVARRDPEGAAILSDLSEASSTAQHVLSRSVALLSDGLSLEQRMTSLGRDAWPQHVRDGAPDALNALADKYGVNAA